LVSVFSHSIRCSSKGDCSFPSACRRNNCSQPFPVSGWNSFTVPPVRGDILTAPSDLPFNSWPGVPLLFSVKTTWFRKKQLLKLLMQLHTIDIFSSSLFCPTLINIKHECSFPSLWFHIDSLNRSFLHNFQSFGIFIGYTVLDHTASPFSLISRESVVGQYKILAVLWMFNYVTWKIYRKMSPG